MPSVKVITMKAIAEVRSWAERKRLKFGNLYIVNCVVPNADRKRCFRRARTINLLFFGLE